MKKQFMLITVLAVALYLLPNSAYADSHCFDVETSKGTLTTAYEASKNEAITGEIDATGCDIGVYIPDGVKNAGVSAEIHDADQYGVFVNGNAKIEGSEVYNIGHHDVLGNYDPNGSQLGVGVYFFDSTGSVSDSYVHDYQKGGIVANEDSKVNVTNNTVGGFDPIPFIAQNGIQFGYGSTGNIMDNSVTGNWYTGAGWTSTGILIFETDNVTVQENTVEDSQTGIGIEAWCWFRDSASNNNIVSNTVLGADWGATVTTYGFTPYSACAASADNNKVVNNVIESVDGEDGVFVGAVQYVGPFVPTADNNKVIHNTISGFTSNLSQFGNTSSKVHANVIE